MTIEIQDQKVYKLTIPRPQYDRLASAFDSMVDEDHFVRFDIDEDTVTFLVPENFRARLMKYATNPDSHKFWITQMFLPENIDQYLITH